MTSTVNKVLEVTGVDVVYGTGDNRVAAVRDISMSLPEGSTIGLVGESGSGKSTLARAICGLTPIARGEISFPSMTESRAARRVQMVFQDPYSSLNPKMRVGQTLGEALRLAKASGASRHISGVDEILDLVSLPASVRKAFPGALSGGQRQRVAIARAICMEPQLIVADEITSALDVSVQGSILNLVREIQSRLGMSMLFVSHNLAVVRYVSDYVYVMYAGRIVEHGPVEEITTNPKHPYTRGLLASGLSVGEGSQFDPSTIPAGEPADPMALPSGCSFHPRCPVGPINDSSREVCVSTVPCIEQGAESGHGVACHFPLSEMMTMRPPQR